MTQLSNKDRQVITPLGIGSHLEYWGYLSENIHEVVWQTSFHADSELTVYILPTRHYSGRLFDKNKTLWAAFALQTPQHKIFFREGSGYDPHFKEIGDALGEFDLVILDRSQYDSRWLFIHMIPEEAVQPADDLHTKILLLCILVNFRYQGIHGMSLLLVLQRQD
ncbi:MBL fold metallo-hydrolase [Entomomonas asaccharolytica]|uniref:MBL fold metallo-hydrolase n=1 Tax=Entomomonas asaccharolytica TaxID=2785331 RepID=UPI00363987D5